MSLQLQIRKPEQTKPFVIGIVGCDGRSIKTKEQEEKIKSVIESILLATKNGKEIITSVLEFKGNEVWDACLKPIEYESLVVVSGGCPVGTKHFYCTDCDAWILPSALEVHNSIYPNHKGLEVYNQGGVDTFAEIIATKLGIPADIKRPEVHQWESAWQCRVCGIINVNESHSKAFMLDNHCRIVHNGKDTLIELKGYKSRNIDIIEVSDVLYDIETVGNCRHCGGGTEIPNEKYAEGLLRKNLETILHSVKKCKWCKGTGTYSGGTWTYREALKRGKEAYQVVIE